MPEVAWQAQRLRRGCELARAALADLEHLDSPSLWRGPAARVFGEELAELQAAIRPALGAAARAADAIDPATAPGAG